MAFNIKKKDTTYFSNRNDWRKWLEANFDREKEIWLLFPKKNSDKVRILYNDAVEEALCFGWIDSIVKPIDDKAYTQRFTPRNPRSSYSQPNIERLKWLSKNNMIHPSVEETVREVINTEFNFPDDIIAEIRKDKDAYINYRKFSEPYRRIRIAYINVARSRPEEFNKRLNYFLKMTRENKLIAGTGGVAKYY